MSEQKPPSPSPQFIRSTKAAVAYWRKRTKKTDDDTIRQLDDERQNLFQAVQLGLELSQTQHDTAIVALQTFDLAERQGYWQEWIPVLKQAISVCVAEQLPLKFRLLSKLGQLQRLTGQLSTAIETHQKAESLAREVDNKQMLAIAYANLSEDYLRSRDYTATEKYGFAALTELHKLDGMAYWEAITLNTLGEMFRFCGHLSTSEEMLSQSVTIRRDLDQPIYLIHALNKLAITLQTAGKFDIALQCYEEASQLLAATPYALTKAMIQVNLGALYSRYEQWDKSEEILRQVNLAYLHQSNKIYYEAAVLQSLGNVLLKQDRAGEAITYLQHAITLWQAIGEELEQANSIGTLGEAFVMQGQIEGAIPLYEKAITLVGNFPDNIRARNLQNEFMLNLKQLVSE